MTARDLNDTAAALFAARYGETLPAPDASALNPVLETLLGHRSVRAFEPRPLAEGTLEWLVAAAQSAASSSNLQTWSVIAVQDADRKARLAALAGDQAHIRQAPLLLVWLADLSRLHGIERREQRPAEGLHYLDTWLMGAIDAALAAQNAAVAAESLGLGTVYIGALRNRPEEVAAELGLQPGAFALFGLVLGHPDAAKPAAVKPRLPASAVLFREQHAAARSDDELARYDRTLRRFQAAERLPETDWTAQSLARLATPADLKGRHRLREALAARGFQLK